MEKLLVTSALPYANGEIHIGHLVEYIQTDIYVRFHRLLGHDVIYLCASDTHGTPIEIKAAELGLSPEELVAHFNKRHFEDFSRFQIRFDRFYTTHSPETERHAVAIFEGLKGAGLIYTKEVELTYCEHDGRFLPDRYVRGTCPKCGAEDQFGDNCEVCGTTYDPTDLQAPHCAICGTPPVRRTSTHYFFALSRCRDQIAGWIAEYDGIEVSDYVEGQTNFVSDAEIRAHALGTAKDARAAFLESRRTAAAMGATNEWDKLEGVTNHGNTVYVAASALKYSMDKGWGHKDWSTGAMDEARVRLFGRRLE